jgi:hypothetical protein
MTRSLPGHVLALLATTLLAVIVLPACEKKKPPVVDAAPPPPPPVDAGVVQLVPLDDAGDAAPEAASGPARPHSNGTPTNTNTARIRLCCNAIRGEAKKLGAAPEAMVLVGIAAQCDVLALQASSGSAPEFAQVRQMLKGRTIPNACAGM